MPWNKKEYPPDWKEIRERILIRANNHCEHCGIENHTYRLTGKSILGFEKRTYIVLTIAHLDHDKSNFEVSNDRLAALCQACHLKYDLSRHIENRKYGRNHRKDQGKLF